jgi:hypothetical protein
MKDALLSGLYGAAAPAILVISAALVIALRMLPALPARWDLRILAVVALGGFGLHLLTVLVYATTPTFLGFTDLTAANVVSVYRMGFPLYGDTADGYGHALLYGPLCFLPVLWSFELLGPSIWAARVFYCVSYCAWIAGVIVFCFFLRQRRYEAWALAAFFFATGFFLVFDFLLVQLMSLAACFTAFKSVWARAVVTGLATAIAGGFRIHGFVYTWVGVFRSVSILNPHTYLPGVLAAGVAFAAFAVLFLPSGVSFAEYFRLLRDGTEHGFPITMIVQHSLWAVVLLIAAWSVREAIPVDGEDSATRIACRAGCLLSVFAVCAASFKAGSGPHHVIAALPVCLLAFAGWKGHPDGYGNQNMRFLVLALTLSVGIIGSARGAKNLFDLVRFPSGEAIAEIYAMSAQTDGEIMLGIGDLPEGDWKRPSSPARSLHLAFLFPVAPVGGNIPALMDFARSGYDVTLGYLGRIAEANPRFIAFPRQAIPFRINNWYDGEPLFGDALRDWFAKHYEFATAGEFFDIYRRRPSGEPAEGSE